MRVFSRALFLTLLFIVSISPTPSFSQTLSALQFTNSLLSIAHVALFSAHSETESPYLIVEFSGSASEMKKKLDRRGRVVRFIPPSGFIIKTADSNKIKSLPGVTRVVPFSPYLKVDQSVLERDDDSEISLQLNLFPGEEAQKFIEQLQALSIAVTAQSKTLVVVKVNRQRVTQVATLSGVEWIEEDKDVVLPAMRPLNLLPVTAEKVNFESFQGHASGAKILKPDALYELDIRGDGELVAMADTGLDMGKLSDLPKDLEGRVLKGEGLGRLLTQSWNDPSGHGTHVAGLIAGDGTASNGHVRGVAHKAFLSVQSSFTWESWGGRIIKSVKPPASVRDYLDLAYADGARVHTNSWHYASNNTYGAHAAEVDQFIWDHPDMVVLFAAGNAGVDFDGDGRVDESSIVNPSTAKNCITVGASENLIFSAGLQETWGVIGSLGPKKSLFGVSPLNLDMPSDNARGLAAFSSRGPTSDGRLKPDVVAPGTNNLSLRSRLTEVDPKESWGVFDDTYLFMGGTSMATPLVAGAAALVRQYYREVEGMSQISSALVKATLINGAQDLFPGQFAQFQEIPGPRPNVHEGFGRVDLERSLVPVGSRRRFSFDDVKGLKEGETKNYFLRVTDKAEPLSVTLVYADYPASPAAALALVNDLDVVVVSRGGSAIYPNRLRKADRKNNVEHVEIESPEVGAVLVKVSAHSIPFGKGEEARQPFALVISGGAEMTLER